MYVRLPRYPAALLLPPTVALAAAASVATLPAEWRIATPVLLGLIGTALLLAWLRRRERAAFRATLAAADVALLALDAALRVVYVSRAAQRLLAPRLRTRTPLLDACPALEGGELHRVLLRALDGATGRVEDCGSLCAGPAAARVGPVGRQVWMVLEDTSERARATAAQRAAEAALEEDRQRLAFAVETAGVGLWEWQLGSERVRYSRGWKRLLGYEDDEVAGEFDEWRRRVHPDDAAPTLERVNAYLADPGGLFQAEFRMRHRDGSWRWMLSAGALQHDADGRATHLLGAHMDITARKQAEAAVRDSEAKLRRVVDGLGPHMFVALLDTDGVIHWVNQAVLDATGLPASAMVGHPMPEAPAWRNDPATRARVAASVPAAAAGRAVRFDQQVEVAGGQRLWLDYALQPVAGGDGTVAWLLASATDITARKNAEAHLREREATLSALFAHISDAMFLLDADDGFRFRAVNPAFVRSCDCTEAPLGRRPEEVLAAPVSRALLERAARAIRTRQPVRWEQVRPEADDVGEATLVPVFDASGQCVQLVGHVHDVSEARRGARRLREAVVRQRRLAKRLVDVQDAEQRRLSAELHDRIGQNLTALGLGLELLSTAALDADARGAHLRDAKQLLERTTAAVRDLITELRPAVLDEYGLLAGLRCLAEDVARHSGLHIHVHGHEPEPRLPADQETALFRIAQEAVANAVKHAGASRVELTLQPGDIGPRLEVRDDGCGFEPGAPPRGSRQHWGLEIMRERAAAIGAHLHLATAPGRGTCITVAFGTRP